jgi:flagellar biosynthesis chaperone FliJ
MEEKNKLGNINFIDQDGKPIIKSDNSPFPASFYFDKFYEEKEYKKFIKNIEKLIRTSNEYRNYIEQLHNTVAALNIDNILSYITDSDANVEFHHYPFTLYDIVDIVIIQKFFEQQNFTSFSIAKEIMELHYKNLIGIVPLTKTMHELAHAGELFLSSKQIFGNYKEFMKRYSEGINKDLKQKIDEMENSTEADYPSDIGGLF